MILQLDPQIPLETPKGSALAHFLIDYGIEHDLQWVCFIDATGECWTYRNKEIRAQKNITWGRLTAKKICTLKDLMDSEKEYNT
jgi:hypothetical protein